MPTPLFSINRGPSGNLATQVFHDGYVYYTTDTHRLYIDCSITSEDGAAAVLGTNRFQIEVENAANATNAEKAASLTAGKGSVSKPIYIDSTGKPQQCTSVDLKATSAGTADKARKLINSSNADYAVGADGKTIVYFADGVPTKSATTVGDVNTPVYLNAGVLTVCTSVDATSSGALKLVKIVSGAEQDQAAGSATVPVYFSDGVPKACTSISLKADTAGTADVAKKLNNTSAIGSSTKPVYFTADGVPSACGNSLGVSITGNAATASSAAKLSADDKGSATVPVYFSNGVPVACTSISLKADTAGTADVAKKLNNTSAIGSSTKPVYFTSGGVPSACGDSLGVSITGNAATASSAAKLSAADKGSATVPIYFANGVPATCNMKFSLASGSTVNNSSLAATTNDDNIASTKWVQSAINNKMAAANAMTFKGTIALTGTAGTTADVIGVPTTQNAGDTYMINVAGTYAGQSAEAGDLLIAIKDRSSAGSSITNSEWTVAQTNINGAVVSDTTDKGSATVPVYISGRSVKACTSLSLNTSGSAARLNNTSAIGSSTKPVYFTADGVPTACGSSLAVSITGNAATATSANSATTAASAAKLSAEDKGSATVPVYFSNGVPVACTSISLKADTAGTADVAKKLNNTSAIGSSTKPVYFTSGGVPSACGDSLAVSITGNAATASSAAKLSAADKGSATVPIYFANGVPAACTSLSLNTSGSAARLSNTSAIGSSTKPVYFTSGGVPTACGDSLAVSITGNAATATSATSATSATTATKLSSNAGSVSRPVYFTGGKPAEITSLDLGSGDINCDAITANTIQGTIVYGAVWNDYAEFREGAAQVEPGRIVYEVGDDTVALTDRRMMAAVSAVSDTFGFAIGETDKAQLPLAVAGRVLVYTDVDRTEFKAGDVVCSGPNGTVSKMTREEIREYPECILGVVSAIPSYETWGTGNVKVNGRIWVTIK